MQKLQCELCSSLDIVKQDGLFVCQSCGCKYTLEEARAMILDGPVDVQGTVSLDRSDEFSGIVRNADSTFSDGNYKEAFSLYSQALSIDPDSAHAILRRALCSAWQSSVADCRVNELINASRRTFELIHEQEGDTAEYFDFCTVRTKEINDVVNAIAQMYIRYYENEITPDSDSLNREIREEVWNGIQNCCIAMKNADVYIRSEVEDYSQTDELFWENLETILENAKVFLFNADMRPDPDLDERIRMVRKLKESWLDGRRASYFGQHPDRKAEMDTLLAEVTAKCQARNELDAKYESLGLFARSEKKSVMDDMERLSAEIREFNSRIDAIRREAESAC